MRERVREGDAGVMLRKVKRERETRKCATCGKQKRVCARVPHKNSTKTAQKQRKTQTTSSVVVVVVVVVPATKTKQNKGKEEAKKTPTTPLNKHGIAVCALYFEG